MRKQLCLHQRTKQLIHKVIVVAEQTSETRIVVVTVSERKITCMSTGRSPRTAWSFQKGSCNKGFGIHGRLRTFKACCKQHHKKPSYVYLP